MCRDQVTASGAALQPAVVLELILPIIFFFLVFFSSLSSFDFSFFTFLSLSLISFKRQGNQACLVEGLTFSPIFM